MKTYPSIPAQVNAGLNVMAFNKLDGCFPHTANVTLADGSTKKITKIVSGDDVLGVKNGKVCTSKVINTINHGVNTDGWLAIKGKRCGVGKGSHYFVIKCTPNHKIWCANRNNYTPAANLIEGDTVLVHRMDLGLTPIQEQVLLGKMLGAGSLNSITHSAHIVWSHTKKDIEYVKWTSEALGDLATNKYEKHISGYGSVMIRSRTTNSFYIKDKFLPMMSGGKKHIPDFVINDITPITLAFWYMDDGSLSHSKKQEDRCVFATDGFSKCDCDKLAKAFLKFNIKAIPFKVKGRWEMRLNSDDAEKLFLLITPYVPTCMQRKLPERYRGYQAWMPKQHMRYKSKLIEHKINSITTVSIPSKKYDIETETHNYFVSGTLVHNSNIRAEWSPKKGFYKYGTRKRLLGADEKPLGEAIELIKNKYADSLHNILKQSRTQRAICFFEFWGDGSAFGHHLNETHDVTLIDVAFFKKGVISPKDFVDIFGSVDHAEILYSGPADHEFIESVRNGTLEGMGPEGVVCKAGFDRKLGCPTMFKVKRNDWYERLREHCGQDDQLFQELS